MTFFHICFRKEAEIIFKIAKEEHVTGKGHIWIVSQSIVGDLDKEPTAPAEFPIGLMGEFCQERVDVKSCPRFAARALVVVNFPSCAPLDTAVPKSCPLHCDISYRELQHR